MQEADPLELACRRQIVVEVKQVAQVIEGDVAARLFRPRANSRTCEPSGRILKTPPVRRSVACEPSRLWRR